MLKDPEGSFAAGKESPSMDSQSLLKRNMEMLIDSPGKAGDYCREWKLSIFSILENTFYKSS